jgi:hypothetical protein
MIILKASRGKWGWKWPVFWWYWDLDSKIFTLQGRHAIAWAILQPPNDLDFLSPHLTQARTEKKCSVEKSSHTKLHGIESWICKTEILVSPRPSMLESLWSVGDCNFQEQRRKLHVAFGSYGPSAGTKHLTLLPPNHRWEGHGPPHKWQVALRGFVDFALLFVMVSGLAWSSSLGDKSISSLTTVIPEIVSTSYYNWELDFPKPMSSFLKQPESSKLFWVMASR